MVRVSLAAVFSVVLVAGAAPNARAQVELKNDGFNSGDAVFFQSGFAPTDEGAVRLTPTGTEPFQVTKVRLLFGPTAVQRDITLHIYDNPGTGVEPGTELYFGDYTLTGSMDAFSEIDLTALNIFVTGPFRVSIEFMQSGDPQIARDADGTNNMGRNFVKDIPNFGGWFDTFGFVQGDWIIRADILDGTGAGPADAGPGGSSDGGSTSGGPDAGTGQACSLNSDCPNGQYCGDTSACTFDCRLDIDCESGSECNEIGQCVEKGGGGGCRAGGPVTTGGAALVLLCLAGLGACVRRRPARRRIRRR